MHVRLTGLASGLDPDTVSEFEQSFWEGLAVDRNEAEARTRQQLWQSDVSVVSARAETEMAPVGDSTVISLASMGAEDRPQW